MTSRMREIIDRYLAAESSRTNYEVNQGRLNVLVLIISLERRGITLDVQEGELVVSPATYLTAGEAEQVRGLTVELIEAITNREQRRRQRTHCVSCKAPLPSGSWARCPDCVAAAYAAREERWRRTHDGESAGHD